MTFTRVDFSRYVVISIWFGCNNHCTICMLSDMKSRLPAISFENYQRVLLDIRRYDRFENLILSGAEVTTFEGLDRFVEFAASLEYFKKIQIQTNGRRLKDRAYLNHLIDCGVNEFFVSIHGFEESHDRATCIPGSFKEVHEGLRNLADCNVNVISNTVLNRDNLSETVKFIHFMSKECVSEIHIWNYFPMEPKDSRDLLIRFTDLMHMLPELKEIAKAFGKVIVLKSFPLCFSTGAPIFFDSVFPETVLPDLFWREFSKCGFGRCVYRDAGDCHNIECWGLSSAYIHKYGDERDLLSPKY